MDAYDLAVFGFSGRAETPLYVRSTYAKLIPGVTCQISVPLRAKLPSSPWGSGKTASQARREGRKTLQINILVSVMP
jgi:hypothetical protein